MFKQVSIFFLISLFSLALNITCIAQVELIIPWDSLAVVDKPSTGSLLDLDIKQLPLSISIIEEEEIQLSGARHLSELLEIYVPGFQYMYNKWNGIIWGMRGVATDKNTKFIFLVNGRKMNQESRDGAYSELDLGFLSDLKRVEVLRGPAGLLYGSGSIAGVINLITKSFVLDKLEAESSIHTWNLKTAGTTQNVLFSHHLGNSSSLQIYAGFRASQGSGTGTPRLFGRPSWPSPQDSATYFPVDGAATQGSSWATPGNFILSADYQIKEWRIYGRWTHQVTDASSLFVADPWPEIVGSVTSDSNISNRHVNDNIESPQGFYGNTEAWGDNRRQYKVDNIMMQVNKDFKLKNNLFKINGGIDMVSNKISLQKVAYFLDTLMDGKSYTTIESFGEKRINLTGTYIVSKKAKDKLGYKYQLATGIDSRLFICGRGIAGKNEHYEYVNKPVISNVNYFNQAVFAEGVLFLSKRIMLDIGLRYDIHTKTLQHGGLLSSRIGMVYTPPLPGFNFRWVFQSSGNNGSVDNYEYNKYNYHTNGDLKKDYAYANDTREPDLYSDVIKPLPKGELSKLKPEKAYSLELSGSYQKKDFRFTTTSSYNIIDQLFSWNQTTFRDFNLNKYSFFNEELELTYISPRGRFKIGANHVFTRLLLDPNQIMKEEVAMNRGISVSAPNDPNKFIPERSEMADTIRGIRNSISIDGKNFLNLSTHISKVFFHFKFNEQFSIHSDSRLFWGIPGRGKLQQPMGEMLKDPILADIALKYKNNNFPYLDIDKKLMVKWNISFQYKWKQSSIQLFVYDILSNPKNKKNINSIRPQHIANVKEQTDLYGYDFRSIALKVTLGF